MNRREFLGALAALPFPAEPGFTALFDGTSLAGWSVQDGPESAFYADKGDMVAHASSEYPAWLRSAARYENFELRSDFFLRGWIDGGVYLHAPEHGRASWCGFKINIFHQRDERPAANSMGAIFPLIAPAKVNVRNQGEWNSLRILMDWPALRVWVNDEQVQDANCEAHPELRHRLRSGYLGLVALGYPLRLRNLRMRELPPKERWEALYEKPEDFGKWFLSENSERAPARFVPAGGVLWADGSGSLATKEKYRDFELHLYVRHARHHNGGILFRSEGRGLPGKRRYEIQLHDVEEAHFPTGSLYSFERAKYPRIEAGKWFLVQLRVEGKRCLVRIDGETVLDYDKLENLEEGHLELQAHAPGRWTEFKQVRVKRL